MYWLRSLLPALIAAIVTMSVTPAVARLAVRLQAVDVPGGRRQHARSTPRMGGIAIVVGILIALVPCLLLLTGSTLQSISSTEILWFLVAALIIFVLGLIDDTTDIATWKKFVAQFFAASIVVAIGWQFTALRIPWGDGRLELGAISPILSILWIVGVTNAINLVDGLDGLAAGLVAIIASSLLLLGILQRSPETVVVTSCVVGASLGFLRHNWRPARVFMGDSGSLVLGFILASISLRTSVKASAAVAILVPILALGLPVLDTLLVMWYRFLRGHPRSNRLAGMFRADRRHTHHLLIDSEGNRPSAVLILYGLALAFCLMALIVAVSGNLWLGIGFLMVEVAAVLLTRASALKAVRRLANERRTHLEETDVAEDTPASTGEGS